MAAGNTYIPIATQTLSSAAASVTFSNISGSYTDLVLIVSAKHSTGTPTMRLQFNSDTNTNYSTTLIYGDGTSGGSVRINNEASANIAGLSDDFGTTIINLNSYSNTTTYKTVFSHYNFVAPAYSETGSKVSTWRSTAAITNILVFPLSSTFTSGSTFSLYGIAAA